jgi:hypothetical protein
LICAGNFLKKVHCTFLSAGGVCLCLALVDPGRGHGGEAHPVTHHQHNVPLQNQNIGKLSLLIVNSSKEKFKSASSVWYENTGNMNLRNSIYFTFTFLMLRTSIDISTQRYHVY